MEKMDKNSLVVVCDSYFLSVNTGQSGDSRSPSPNRSLRGFNIFRVISQKIGRGIRKSNKEYKSTSSEEDEDSTSSVNSIPRTTKKNQNRREEKRCDCNFFYKNQGNPETENKNKPKGQECGKKCLKFAMPSRHHHSSGSDTYSSNDDSSESNENDRKSNGRSHFSSNDSSASSSSSCGTSYKHSSETVRKGLKNLNLSSKSLSCFSLYQVKDNSERRESKTKTKKSPQKILRPPATHTYVRGISGLPTLKVINTRACYDNQYSRG